MSAEFTVTNCRFEPDATQQENELIAEKLLGWKRIPPPHGVACWDMGDTHTSRTPTFTDWQSAGLIIDAMKPYRTDRSNKGDGSNGRWFHEYLAECLFDGTLSPSEVRSAALSYLRARE